MLLRALLMGMVLSFTAHAQEKKPTAQQARMADCNKQASAKGMKGDPRKEFMSSCLKDKPQERMAKCNQDAKGMKGDERKKFMSECLKA